MKMQGSFVLLALLVASSAFACTISTIATRNDPLFQPGGDLELMSMDKCCSNLNVGGYQLKRGITRSSSSEGALKPSRNVNLSPGNGISGTSGFEEERFEFVTGRGVLEGHCTLTENGVRVRALGITFNDRREAALRCDCRDPNGAMSFLVLERKDGHHRPGTLQVLGGQFKLEVVTKATGMAVVPVGYRVAGDQKTVGAIQISSTTLDRYLWLARDIEPSDRDHLACVLSGALVYHQANR